MSCRTVRLCLLPTPSIGVRGKADVGTQTRGVWFGRRWRGAAGSDNRLLEDAGGINVMRRPDDPRLDDTTQMASETLLTEGGKADCWLWRDPISKRFGDQRFLAHMRAWRDGCVFAADGRVKPEADAFDLFETAALRPDLLLRDYARMLHPELRGWPATWVRQDERVGKSAGVGHGS